MMSVTLVVLPDLKWLTLLFKSLSHRLLIDGDIGARHRRRAFCVVNDSSNYVSCQYPPTCRTIIRLWDNIHLRVTVDFKRNINEQIETQPNAHHWHSKPENSKNRALKMLIDRCGNSTFNGTIIVKYYTRLRFSNYSGLECLRTIRAGPFGSSVGVKTQHFILTPLECCGL